MKCEQNTLNHVEEIVKYYSKSSNEFHLTPKYSEKLNKLSLIKSKDDFKKIDKYTYLIKIIFLLI